MFGESLKKTGWTVMGAELGLLVELVVQGLWVLLIFALLREAQLRTSGVPPGPSC